MFIYLLLSANHKDGKWQGIEVLRGQHITSVEKIAQNTGLSRQKVRTALGKLESTGEIAVTATNRYTLITVVKWAVYQHDTDDTNQQNNQPFNQQITNNQPAQQPLNNHKQEVKEVKNLRMEEKPLPPAAIEDNTTDLISIRNNYTFNSELEQAVTGWITYKREKRQAYKPSGLNSLLAQVQKNANTFGDTAVIHAIHESMASNYQGIVWDKAKSAAVTNTATSKGNPFFDYARRLDEHETILEGEMP